MTEEIKHTIDRKLLFAATGNSYSVDRIYKYNNVFSIWPNGSEEDVYITKPHLTTNSIKKILEINFPDFRNLLRSDYYLYEDKNIREELLYEFSILVKKRFRTLLLDCIHDNVITNEHENGLFQNFEKYFVSQVVNLFNQVKSPLESVQKLAILNNKRRNLLKRMGISKTEFGRLCLLQFCKEVEYSFSIRKIFYLLRNFQIGLNDIKKSKFYSIYKNYLENGIESYKNAFDIKYYAWLHYNNGSVIN